MEKSDGKSTSGSTEKQFVIYRRKRKRIGVKSAIGCGTITYTDCVDELVFKVINAPTKRMKIEYV